MRRFAESTTVPVDRTRAEIERTLAQSGATRFMNGWDGDAIDLVMPDRTDGEYTQSGRGRRSPSVALRHWEQACKARWRALLLVIRAKLEAVACGISTVEDEFLAWTVVPGDGRTVGQVLQPQIEHAITHNTRPTLLLGNGDD